MKSILYSTLLIIAAQVCSASTYSPFIDSKYNSLSTSIESFRGDADGTSFTLSGSVEPAEGLLLNYDYIDSDIDTILGVDVNPVDTEATTNYYGFGYIFRNQGFHFIPSISFGNRDFSFFGVDFLDQDLTRLSFAFRVPMSDKSIFNFTVENISVDSEFSNLMKEAIAVSNFTGIEFVDEAEMNEAKADVDRVLGDETRVSAGLEIHYNDNLSVTYGFTSVDFDNTVISVDATYNF